MTVEVRVPTLGESVTEATVATTWIVVDDAVLAHHARLPIGRAKRDAEVFVDDGELCIAGAHVMRGYLNRADLNAARMFTRHGERAFRTGDLGVMSEGEMFIIGRIKDMLIVDGRNHYPDDIEATIQEITGGRVAAISVLDDTSEQLVAVVEMKKKGTSEAEALDKLRAVKREVASAIKKSHSVRVSDLVLVAPGSIPITTSGKIRRSACVDRYRLDEFSRLDVTT